MKVLFITTCLTLCIIFAFADAGRRGGHRGGGDGGQGRGQGGRGRGGRNNKDRQLEMCMERCDCYSGFHLYAILWWKGYSCRSCFQQNCTSNWRELNITECFNTCPQCKPRNFDTKMAACTSCQKNCEEKYKKPDPDTEIKTMTECFATCETSERCSNVVTPSDLLVNQTEECTSCVKDECDDDSYDGSGASSDGPNCTICAQVDKADCYGAALEEDCDGCVPASEETEEGVMSCYNCLHACTGSEEDDEEDDEEGEEDAGSDGEDSDGEDSDSDGEGY